MERSLSASPIEDSEVRLFGKAPRYMFAPCYMSRRPLHVTGSHTVVHWRAPAHDGLSHVSHVSHPPMRHVSHPQEISGTPKYLTTAAS